VPTRRPSSPGAMEVTQYVGWSTCPIFGHYLACWAVTLAGKVNAYQSETATDCSTDADLRL
jgi:hypothetical protein